MRRAGESKGARLGGGGGAPKSLNHEALEPPVASSSLTISRLKRAESSFSSSSDAGGTPFIASFSSLSFLLTASASARFFAIRRSFHPGPLVAASPFFMNSPNSYRAKQTRQAAEARTGAHGGAGQRRGRTLAVM